MPHIKNALFRYRIIDKCLRNKYKSFPSKQDFREACEEALFGSSHGEHICDSTIEKDLFSMRMEHDAPIEYSRKERGYFYSDPDFSINDVPLNENDIEAIKFAANTLMQFKEVSMFKQFGNAIDKIVNRVAINDSVNEKEANNYVQFESAVSTGGSEHLPVFLEAIQKNVATYFDYENFQSGEIKPRKVLPLLLKEYRNRWYIISFDVVKEKITTYGLDRISNLEMSEEKVQKPQHFNPSNYFKYSTGISSSDTAPEKVVFSCTNVAAKYIESQPFHKSQKKITTTNEGVKFELEIFISEEFIRSILSYGGDVEIQAPKHLREEIKTRLEKMQKRYF